MRSGEERMLHSHAAAQEWDGARRHVQSVVACWRVAVLRKDEGCTAAQSVELMASFTWLHASDSVNTSSKVHNTMILTFSLVTN